MGAVEAAIAAVAATTGIATLGVGVVEYVRQGRQRRAEMFFALRDRLQSDDFSTLAEQLDMAASNNPVDVATANHVIESIPFRTKRAYVGLFEEVAVSMDLGLLGVEVAHEMFGYYAILCADNKVFWNDLNRFSPYWRRFNAFCLEMRARQEKMLIEGSDEP